MAKKTHVKVRLVPEAKPDSAFYYYVKKPAGGEKAKVKLKAKKYNPITRKHETFIEKKLTISINSLYKLGLIQRDFMTIQVQDLKVSNILI